MCVAAPMKILRICGPTATAELHGNEMDIDIRLVRARVGDHVLVHAGCAIEVIGPEVSRELSDLMKEIEDAANDRD